jgi:hypothetical protein
MLVILKEGFIYTLIARLFSYLPRPLARCFGWLALLQSVAVMPDAKEAPSPHGQASFVFCFFSISFAKKLDYRHISCRLLPIQAHAIFVLRNVCVYLQQLSVSLKNRLV